MAVVEQWDANGNLIKRVDTDPHGNEATLIAQGLAALAQNRAYMTQNTASLAIANPTNAQVISAVRSLLAQASALEAQNNAIIRLILQQLDGTN